MGLLCEVDDLDNANAMAGNDELCGSLSLRQEVGELLLVRRRTGSQEGWQVAILHRPTSPE